METIKSCVHELLKWMGIDPGHKGFECLIESIAYAYEYPESQGAFLKENIAHVAEVLNSTPSRVERNMRQAIGAAFRDAWNVHALEQVLGVRSNNLPPSVPNKSFVYRVVSFLKYKCTEPDGSLLLDKR